MSVSPLSGLRAQRDAALNDRTLDLPVAGLDGVFARFRPITAHELKALDARFSKSKDRDYAEFTMNATALADAFLGLFKGEERERLSGDADDADLIAEFCPNIEKPTKAEVMIGILGDDWSVYKTAGALTKWSGAEELAVDEDFRGN